MAAIKQPSASKNAYLARIAAIAVIYHLAARLGLQMAYIQQNTSPVWPPTGIAIAALLLFGMPCWPGISIGVLAGSLLTGAPFTLALGMTLGNTLEALLIVAAIRKMLHFSSAMDKISDVVGLALTSFLFTALGALIGTITLLLTTPTPPTAFLDVWVTWWIGDLLGALVIAPLILVWSHPVQLNRIRKNLAEWAGLFLLVVLISWYVFGKQPPIDVVHQAMIYVIFPFVIWAALRFGQHGATFATLLISAVAIWGTVNGAGPFMQGSLNESLILLQTFTGVVALTSLILGATTLERRQASAALQRRVDDLDTLNSASKSFMGNYDKAGIYRVICKIAVENLGADCAWISAADESKAGSSPLAFFGSPASSVSAPMQSEKGAAPRGQTPGASAAFPLVFGNTALGYLNLNYAQGLALSADQQLLAESYANLAAVAIQNAWLFDEVSRSSEQLHALTQRLMMAQEAERLHLSRELHDESGQILAALMVELGLLAKHAGSGDDGKDHLDKVSSLARDLQVNLHRLAANLRPASLDHLGLEKALEQYVKDFSRQYGIQVDFEAAGLERKRLPTEIETSIFRIVQESLTNVALHAEAAHVDVLVTLRNKRVAAIIEDDGVGFLTSSPASESHLGLFGMKERVEMLRGQFTLESAPGKGTLIKLEVPVGD